MPLQHRTDPKLAADGRKELPDFLPIPVDAAKDAAPTAVRHPGPPDAASSDPAELSGVGDTTPANSKAAESEAPPTGRGEPPGGAVEEPTPTLEAEENPDLPGYVVDDIDRQLADVFGGEHAHANDGMSDENRTARTGCVTSLYVRGDIAGGLE